MQHQGLDYCSNTATTVAKETQLIRAAFELLNSLALLWLDRATKGVDETNYLGALTYQRPE
jgi:hypothetical protein